MSWEKNLSNLPPAQQNLNASARTNGSSTLRLLGYFGILIVSVIVGLAIAVVYYKSRPTLYQSDAKFLISKSTLDPKCEGLDFSSVINRRHDVLLPETNVIMRAVHRYDLNEIPTLRDLAENDVVLEIQKNLTVTQHPDEPSVYEIASLSKNPKDAQTTVATLVSIYERMLREKSEYCLEDQKEIVRQALGDAFQRYKAAAVEPDEKAKERALQHVMDYKDQLIALQNVDHRHFFSFDILDPALRGKPVWPNLLLILAYGAAGGFVVGMCLVLLWALLVKLA